MEAIKILYFENIQRFEIYSSLFIFRATSIFVLRMKLTNKIHSFTSKEFEILRIQIMNMSGPKIDRLGTPWQILRRSDKKALISECCCLLKGYD